MRTFMLKLDGGLRRRGRLVLGVWAALLLCSLPLAMRQSDHLRGGGFDVPGSSSKAVADATGRNFPGAQRTELGAVLVPRRGARPDQLRAAVARLARAAGPVGGVALTPAGRAAADRAGRPGVRSSSRCGSPSPRTARPTWPCTCAIACASTPARATAWPRT